MIGTMDRPEFNRCWRCQGTNTRALGTHIEPTKLIYAGHCDDCDKDYGYSDLFEIIHDKEGRI